MNHANSQNTSNSDFLSAILLDMARSGVTDVISESSIDLFANSIAPKPAPKQEIKKVNKTEVSKPALVETANNITKKSSSLDIDKHVWMVNEGAEIVCVSAGYKNGEEPFKKEEKILFDNMLKAMGLNAEEIGYIVIDESLDLVIHQEQVSQACRRLISGSKAKIIMSFGENMCPVLMGGNVTLSGVRGYGKEVSNVRYVATYAPRVLLKQPLLKSLAWEDLQIAMGYIKVLSND